jgi:hypothetical protein
VKPAEREVKAMKVREGDFLPGLDDGYVYTDADPDYDIRGEYNSVLGGDGYVLISFHTAQGDEGYLLVPEDMPVTIRRGR